MSCWHWHVQVTDLRLRGFRIRERDAVLLGALKLQRLQFDGVAFEGRSLISKLSSLQVTLAAASLFIAIIGLTSPSPNLIDPTLSCAHICSSVSKHRRVPHCA